MSTNVKKTVANYCEAVLCYNNFLVSKADEVRVIAGQPLQEPVAVMAPL